LSNQTAFGYSGFVLDKTIVGIMLVTAVVMWIFVPNSTSTIVVIFGIVIIALAAAMKKKKS
jgi:hypothetical protein